MSKFDDNKKRDFEFSLAGPHRSVSVRLVTGQKKGGYYDSPDGESSGSFASIEETRNPVSAYENEEKTAHDSPDLGEKLKLLFNNLGENRAEVTA